MIKFLTYLKYIGFFFLFLIVITLFISLINVLGLSSPFVSKLSIIFTAILFFFISFFASKKTQDKGYLLGLKLGLFLVLLLILINLIAFKSKFSFERFVYYIILISSSVLGGSIGKNFTKKKM